MKKSKKLLSLVLAVLLCVGMLPTFSLTAFAASQDFGDFTITGDDLSNVSFADNVLTINTDAALTISNKTGVDTTDDCIVIASNNANCANITLKNVTISTTEPYAIRTSSGLNLTLADTNTLTATGKNGVIRSEGDLTIGGTGTLNVSATATDEYDVIGIYGYKSDVTINSGTVKVTGGTDGIDSGTDITISGDDTEVVITNTEDGIDGENITISGGKVTVTDGKRGINGNKNVTINGSGTEVHVTNTSSAGISCGSNGTLIIDGGTVTAEGAEAGISCGNKGTLTIKGGTVTATATDDSMGKAGINSKGSITVEITGGTVTAKGYSGISAVGSVTISGGTVTATGRTDNSVNSNGIEGTLYTTAAGNAFINASSIQYTDDGDNLSGVIFDGDEGQVYGSPTLTTDAEIPAGKRLTIPENSDLTIAEGVTLTNNGTITNNGTLTNNGAIAGTESIISKPAITTTSLSDGKVNEAYTQTLVATGNNITWSLKDGSTLPAGLTLSSDGVISGTPTTAITSAIFTVVAENAAGKAEKELSITIAKADAAITNIEDLTKDYDGTAVANPTYTYNGDGQIAIKWYDDNNNSKGDELAEAPKNAGTYWVGVSAAEGDTYNAAPEEIKQFTIAKATPIIETPPTAPRITVGSKLEASVLNNDGIAKGVGATQIEGVFDWETPTEEMTTIENATRKVIFTPTDTTNYNTAECNVTVEVYRRSSGGGGGVTRYTVKFDTDGAEEIKSVTVNRNGKVTEPIEPTKDGYVFDGWYTDKDLTEKYDFESKVTKSFTLYAKWILDEEQTQPIEPTEWENPFTDVKENDWYYDNVKFAYENGLMKGTSETEFAPNLELTRGMFVTILYRLEGEPAVNRSIPFADVKATDYFANAVIWAEQNEIVSGVSESEFAPNANITREQMATILYRYAKAKGYDVSVGEDTNILSYTDFDKISEYAIEALQYTCGAGLIKGRTESTLNPQDNATRAETAAILQRFIEGNVK